MVKPFLPNSDLKTLEKLTLDLAELKAFYDEIRDRVITTVLGRELAVCIKCSRRMLPRSVWDKTPQDLRNRLAEHITRAGAHGKCASCVTYQYRREPLSPEVLARLRQDVGLIK